jgi:hypothetical protein
MVLVAVEGTLERMQEEHDICVFLRRLSLQTDMRCSVRFNLASCCTRPNGLNAQRDSRVITQKQTGQCCHTGVP